MDHRARDKARNMRRILRYSGATALALLMGYLIALHGLPSVAKGVIGQSRIQREGDSRVIRWTPMFIPGL
jgi:hypothetical protein